MPEAAALVGANLALGTALYARGLARLWRSPAGRSLLPGWRAAAGAAGGAVLLLALLSPLHERASSLLWVHMVQHLLLTGVAAPLLALAAPGLLGTMGLPAQAARGVVRCGRMARNLLPPWHESILFVWAAHAFTLWIWHHPALYDAALRSQALHDLQHLAFFGTALLFWRLLLDPRPQVAVARGVGIVSLFATSLHSMFLGFFMFVSPRPWYPSYPGGAGLSPLEDQQLAGLLMWMPAGLPYLLGASWLFLRGARDE